VRRLREHTAFRPVAIVAAFALFFAVFLPVLHLHGASHETPAAGISAGDLNLHAADAHESCLVCLMLDSTTLDQIPITPVSALLLSINSLVAAVFFTSPRAYALLINRGRGPPAF
jgi:hypothetical protein